MAFSWSIPSVGVHGMVVALLSALILPTYGETNFEEHDDLYQSFDELTTWIGDFAMANADIVELVEFGRSHQDRPLFALQFSLDPGVNNPDKPEFLFTAGLHAREVIGSQAAYQLAEHLASGFRANDPVVIEVLAEREVWVVPNLNPDGRIRVELGNSQHRKTMQWYSGQSLDNHTRGVDLNRNFPHRWEDASDSVTSETYGGPGVLSTPEASSLWTMLGDNDYFSDLWAAVDIHSGAETFIAPWTSKTDLEEHPLPPATQETYDLLMQGMAAATAADGTDGLDTRRLGYDAFGVLADALYENFGAYAFVEEIYAGPWSGSDYFRYFNPLDQAGVDEATGDAVASSMFLLSDTAFPINRVPEPSTFALAGLVVCLLAAFGLRFPQR